MKKMLKNVLCGIVMGISVLMPGLSGGTTAVILGIYRDLLHAADTLVGDFKNSGIYLSAVGCGAAVGFFAFSYPVEFVLTHYRLEFEMLAGGIVIGSIPMLVGSCGKPRVGLIPFGVMGFATVAVFELLPIGGSGNGSLSYIAAVGILSAAALILPGISLSYVLMAFGMYDKTVAAVTGFDLQFLLKLGGTVLLGTVLLSRGLNRLYEKYPTQVNAATVGMTVAALKQVFIRMPTKSELPSSLLLFVGGVFISLFFARFKEGTDRT